MKTILKKMEKFRFSVSVLLSIKSCNSINSHYFYYRRPLKGVRFLLTYSWSIENSNKDCISGGRKSAMSTSVS